MSDPVKGRWIMARMKRVVVGFSEEVLAEIDGIGSRPTSAVQMLSARHVTCILRKRKAALESK